MGHNSGVINFDIYYKPVSLKAINCRRDIELLLEFCNHYNISYEIRGKVIVATTKKELNTLDMFNERFRENGISGLKILSMQELREYEPYAAGLSALYCPETGEYETRFLINCSGLFSYKIAELGGTKRQVRIIPFRGEYFMLKEQACQLVKNLIYPTAVFGAWLVYRPRRILPFFFQGCICRCVAKTGSGNNCR